MGRWLYKALGSDKGIGPRFSQTSSPPPHFTYNLNFTPLCLRIKPRAHFSTLARSQGGSPPDSAAQPCLWQDVAPQLPGPVEIRYPFDRLPPSLHGGTTGPSQKCPSPQPPRLPRLQRRNAGQHHPLHIHHRHPHVPARQGTRHHFP